MGGRQLANKMPPWKKALAKKMNSEKSPPEKILWTKIRDGKLGFWVYAQKPALGYILDFWVPFEQGGLCIEVDGKCHKYRQATDRKRDRVLAANNIRTLRIPAKLVFDTPEGVVALIIKVVNEMKGGGAAK
jgi:very-short-patch-repair endonuclease